MATTPSWPRLVAALCFGLLTTVSLSCAQAGVTLVKNGKATARIYIAGSIDVPELNATQLRKLSAEEKAQRAAATARKQMVDDFNYHIQKMSGATLEVVTTDNKADVKGPAVVFGELANQLGATAKHDTSSDEAFRLVVKDDQVLLGGESSVAASHAMYHLLRSLGCDWLMPSELGEVIPQRRTIALNDMDVAKAPAFVMRAPWYSGGGSIIKGDEFAQFDQWKRRQAQTHGRGGHPDFMRGGHFWAGLLRKYKDRLKEDETMLPLVRQADGTYKYGRAQLEPTHPGVVDMTVDYITEIFEKNNWPVDKAVSFSIGPNDGGGYSESPATLTAGAGRVDPITGDNDQTDVLILYANKVLERVEKKYPNVKLGFYIYSVHADYPMKYKPHPKFVAHFADITYSRYHALTDRGSYTRNYYRNILEQWADLHKEQGNPMWFYGYNWNLAENLMPYSKLLIWGEDLPYYHKMGVMGHNNEQDKAWSILGPHNYLMARQGWDIDLDWRDVLKEYCQKAFGAGAPHMEQYYLNLVETQRTAGHEAGAVHAIPLVLTRDFVKQSKALLAKASAAAKTQRDKNMVEYFGQAVFMLEMFHDYRDATHAFDFVAANKHMQRMKDHWQKYYDVNTNLVSRYGHRYYFKWMYPKFNEFGLKYSTDPYKIVYKFPDELPTILDPEDMGALMGFYEPAINDDHRMKTKTYSSTWDAQGLGPYRDGGVWYRVRFPIDKSLDGKPVGLMIGSVEDTAHVWINGEYVGVGKGYIRPFLFDLTGHVKYGSENLIAIQVIRRSPLNEAGLGGMLFPSFVFTGPQLEKKAPAVEPLKRVLPGAGGG